MGPLPSSVLFACTTNTVRSAMAAAMLRHLHGRRVHVESVGIRAGEANPFAEAVLGEIGLSLVEHRPRTFEDLDDTSFDLVISLSPEAQHTAVEMTRTMACTVEFWHTFDATAVHGNREQRLAAYRAVRDTLWRRIVERFPLPPTPSG